MMAGKVGQYTLESGSPGLDAPVVVTSYSAVPEGADCQSAGGGSPSIPKGLAHGAQPIAQLSARTPEAKEVEKPGPSWWSSLFLLVNSALGTGLLNFPASYHRAGGILMGTVILVVFAVLICGSVLILVYCSDIKGSCNYQDTVYVVCGKWARRACAVLLTIFIFGVCITVFIVIGDQWDQFLTFAYGEDFCHYWYMNRRFTIPMSALLVLPLCFPKTIDFLKYPSAVGVISILYCAVMVVVKYFLGTWTPTEIRTRPKSWTDVFLVIPVICFSFQVHEPVVPVYSCMKDRNLTSLTKTLVVALLICSLVYSLTAGFGYMTFGGKVNEDVLLSYEPTPDVLVAVVLVTIKICTIYPVALFIGRSSLRSLWTDIRHMPDDVTEPPDLLPRVVITFVWFGASLAFAVLLPDIGVVISVLGGLSSIFIFIFPGLCLFFLLRRRSDSLGDNRNRRRFLLAAAIFYLLLGTLVLLLTTAQTIIGFSNPSETMGYSHNSTANNTAWADSINDGHNLTVCIQR